MKNVLSALLLCALCLPTSAAASEKTDELQGQLAALEEYVTTLTATGEPLSGPAKAAVIKDATEWIIAAEEESGHFGYEYWPYEDRYSDDDSIVRQAGTFSLLADVYQRQTVKDKATKATIESSLTYFQGLTETAKEKEITFACIKDTPRSSRCTLGSTALVLVGLLRYVEAEPAERATYEDVIEQYAGYLLAAKRDGAGFSTHYDFEDGFNRTESPFFNGEAMLALVRYYQYEPDAEIKTLLTELFTYLSQKEFETPLYLWIMAALKDMQQLWPNEEYVRYAQDFTKHSLDSAALRHRTTHNYCAAVEEMASAYSVLEDGTDTLFLKRLDREIEFWLQKSARLQLKAALPYRVVFVDGSFTLKKMRDPERAHGGFLTDEAVLNQRIDYTQHCASAYLQKYVDVDGGTL